MTPEAIGLPKSAEPMNRFGVAVLPGARVQCRRCQGWKTPLGAATERRGSGATVVFPGVSISSWVPPVTIHSKRMGIFKNKPSSYLGKPRTMENP